MPEFEIDPDIRKARTLPSSFYTDAKYFELSKERIFKRTWQFAVIDDDRQNLSPFTLLPGFLDEPLLIARNGDVTRCLSNVCTHRGKVLVGSPCSGELIRCGYHGRRFSLDGKFLSMPEFDGVEDFPSDSEDLSIIPSAEFLGFRFVSLSPSTPFEEAEGDVLERFGDVDPASFNLTSTIDYEIDAHWALYSENYLEGFHIPYVHRSLNEVVNYGTYTTETFRFSSLQTGCDDDGKVAGRYLFIFPNTMLNFYPWGVSVNVVEPIAPAKTRVRFLTYVSDESKLNTGAGADLHRVEMEDEAVVESVQKGIRSRFYDRGRYSPTREQGTHHFHRLIAEFME
jgi:choline monooxygenase